jgi:hypothetical protein
LSSGAGLFWLPAKLVSFPRIQNIEVAISNSALIWMGQGFLSKKKGAILDAYIKLASPIGMPKRIVTPGEEPTRFSPRPPGRSTRYVWLGRGRCIPRLLERGRFFQKLSATPSRPVRIENRHLERDTAVQLSYTYDSSLHNRSTTLKSPPDLTSYL